LTGKLYELTLHYDFICYFFPEEAFLIFLFIIAIVFDFTFLLTKPFCFFPFFFACHFSFFDIPILGNFMAADTSWGWVGWDVTP